MIMIPLVFGVTCRLFSATLRACGAALQLVAQVLSLGVGQNRLEYCSGLCAFAIRLVRREIVVQLDI